MKRYQSGLKSVFILICSLLQIGQSELLATTPVICCSDDEYTFQKSTLELKTWVSTSDQRQVRLVAHSGHSWGANCLAISPNESLMASGGGDGKVLIWDLESGKEIRRFEIGTKVPNQTNNLGVSSIVFGAAEENKKSHLLLAGFHGDFSSNAILGSPFSVSICDVVTGVFSRNCRVRKKR